MKNAVAAEGVAGVVGAVVGVITAFVTRSIGPSAPFPIPMMYGVAFMIVPGIIIFGAVFGAIYSRFHDLIPGKGISKGLYFGLMIWFIKDIGAGAYTALTMEQAASGIGLIVVGFFMWIAYGQVLPALNR